MRPNDRLVRVMIVVIVALAACFALFSLHPLAGSYFWPTLIITVIVGCTAWAWLIGHRARQRRIIDRVGAEYLWVPPSADLAGFWMMRTPVTNAQYRQAVAAGECRAPLFRTAYDDVAKAQHPVTYVRRADARKYAAWVGGRLPHDVEWTRAAQGDDGRTWPWGNTPPNAKRANCRPHGPGGTTPVGSYPAGASPYGLLDMAGNVWEWVESDGGRRHIVRGGAFNDAPDDVACSARGELEHGLNGFGFRVVAPSP